MRKFLVSALVIGLFGGISFAGVNEVATAAFAVAQSTPCATACYVKMIIVTSTGTATAVTMRDGTTSKMVFTNAGAAGSYIIDLTGAPIRFSSNLNYSCAAADTSASITVVYEKAPGK